ncbi:MAG: NTP-binding protein, partial [Acidimicrobiia bacterium]
MGSWDGLPDSAESGRRVIPSPHAPMEVARHLAADLYTHAGETRTLRHWRDGWWEWRESHWVEVERTAVRRTAYEYTADAVWMEETKKDGPVETPWAPNRYRIANLLEALAAVCHLVGSFEQPGWINGENRGVIVACSN